MYHALLKETEKIDLAVNEAHTWLSDLIKVIQGEMQSIADKYKEKVVPSSYVPSEPDTSKFKAYIHGKVDFRPFAEEVSGYGARPTVGKIAIGTGLPDSGTIYNDVNASVEKLVNDVNSRITSMANEIKFASGNEKGSAYYSVFVSLKFFTKENGWNSVNARKYVEA